MYPLCRQAIDHARRVFVCQFSAPLGPGVVNDALLADGALPLVPDSAGSNVDVLLGSSAAPASGHMADDDLQRRRALGQFFTPKLVAEFMWGVIEAFGPKALKRDARVIDPACGDGVFL